MAENIRVSRDGAVLTIAIDRTEAGNRLTNEMAGALADALDAAGDSRVILLRAQGPDFCLGRDIEPPAPGAGVRALDVLRDDAGPIIALYAALARRNQPIVGLVQGKAWGIGLVLAAMCDLTFVTQGSSFRLRELERGIPPCIAMAPLLDRLAGKALAHLVYTAGEMDAAWALTHGVAGEIVADGALESRAREAAEKMASFPREVVEAVKQFMAHALHSGESRAALYGASLLANVLGSR
ncbi:enoyl-CoA hydratase/isomerase family protein [Variovorax terrae]|uniref:Enoyl-CoA hydratase/isomerase family protein n=1 Tax=Variovorax terrae TaxID=2923278 RepID=A0A9X1VWV1_9BURK|nr:enoyl-CoA hydratase/isomerase family protein [Variovorax terrae]MCJ0764892.1 enoyl-CoA hydratase/isomerase family protein [Variovorax terrae]